MKEKKRELKGRRTTSMVNTRLWKGLETSFSRARRHYVHAINTLQSWETSKTSLLFTKGILETTDIRKDKNH